MQYLPFYKDSLAYFCLKVKLRKPLKAKKIVVAIYSNIKLEIRNEEI